MLSLTKQVTQPTSNAGNQLAHLEDIGEHVTLMGVVIDDKYRWHGNIVLRRNWMRPRSRWRALTTLYAATWR